MINKKLIEKYIKCCILLLFTANLYSMQDNMSFLRQYYNTTRYLSQLIRDGMDDDFINTIIQNQIDVNFIDEFGQTPLILACRLNNLKLVKFILTIGGIIDFIDLSGKSALCYAQENANNEIINLLIENNKNSKVYDSKADKRYKCKIEGCLYRTNGIAHFKTHMSAHESESQYKCNIGGCGYITVKQSSFNSHMRRIHPQIDIGYKCKIEGCPYTTNSKFHLKAHVSAHESGSQYKCNIEGCGHISVNRPNFNSHMRRIHPQIDIGYKCKIEGCPYTTNSKFRLKTHMSAHESGSQYKCNIEGCGHIAVNQPNFNYHMQNSHPQIDISYKCKIEDCPYTTNSKFRFETHILAHNSKNCYKCNVEGCGYISTNKGNVYSHTRYNHPEVDVRSYEYYKCKIEGYKCKIEGCPYTTNSKFRFETHILAHNSKNCYKCNVEGCGYISTKKYNVDDHTRRRHHPEVDVSYRCEVKDCRDIAKYKSDLDSIEKDALDIDQAFKYIDIENIIDNDNNENILFKCTKCKFESKSKLKLTLHFINHNLPSKKIKKKL